MTEPQPTRPGRSVAMWLTTGALAVVALVSLVVFIQFFIPPEAGDPFFFIFVGFEAAFIVLAALAIWRPRPWVYLTGGIVVLLFFGLNAAFILALLWRPIGAPEELPWAGVILDVLAPVAFVVSIVAFRQARRGTWTPASSGGRTALLGATFAGLIAGIFYVSFVGSFALSASGGTGVKNGILEPPTQEAVSLAAEDVEWSTDRLEAETGIVPVYVLNRDDFGHTFDVDIDGEHLSYPVAAGSTTVALVRVDQPGEYRFWCAVPGHDAMKGTLTVG